MRDYSKLEVWQVAHKLTLEIYKKTCSLPKEENFGLKSQIRRAAISVPANIAEGSGRKSNMDFRKYLIIALGSASETEYYIRLCKDLGYIDNSESDELMTKYIVLKKQLQAFINRLSEYDAQ
jgi:four helix bundle protein